MYYRRWPLVRQFKLNLLRFVRLQGSPEEIAKGFALGIFIGLTPTFGVQIVLAVFCAMLLGENKLSAALGVWVTNPLTAPFIYAAEYELGRIMLGMDLVQLPGEFSLSALRTLSWEVLLPLTLGSLIIGSLGAFAAYLLAVRLVPLLKNHRIPRWPRRPRRP